MNNLNLKETTALELRYLGNSTRKIAKKIETPFDTVNGWFKSEGKLYSIFNDYSDRLNEKREKVFWNRLSISDEEFFIITSNVVRYFAKRLQKKRVLLVNEEGNAVADSEGMPQYIEKEPDVKFTVRDLKTVWEMQRIMQGKPTKYEKQEIREENNFDSEAVIRELGLEAEDFEDEKLEETMIKVTKHLLKK